MNGIQAAVFLVRLNKIFQEARGVSRTSKAAASETVFLLVAGLTGARVAARPAPALTLGFEDAKAMVSGFVEFLEQAGIARPDIGALFNVAVRGLPPAAPRPAHTTPDVPTGFVLVRDDVLTTLAAGAPVTAETRNAP